MPSPRALRPYPLKGGAPGAAPTAD
jgi:hypothetical protein